MPIRYLNTSVVTGQGSTSLFKNIPYQVTISNTSPSVSTVTGALVVAGGIGTSGNIYLQNLVASGDVTGFNAKFTGLLDAGAITSFSINNAGEITSSSANIGQIETTNIVGGDGSFEDVTVSGFLDAYRINSGEITFSTSLSGPAASITNLNSTNTTTDTLEVNTIVPSDSGSINLGSITQLTILGGAVGQVLSTDGNGNLTWTEGADQLQWGYGLTKNGLTVSLTQTGVTPGVYNSVNVDAYGRVLAGYTQGMSLQDVTDAGASTTNQISISNTTNATDTYIGALTVAGGIGVGATLFTESLQVVNSALFNSAINVSEDATINETLYLKGQTTGVVPLKFDSANLIGSPEVGGMEFTGSNLYITTDTGRKLVIIRDSDASALIQVNAVTEYNITVSNPQQTILVGGNYINPWDGVTLYPGDKVLLTNQTTPSQNGIYNWNGVGTALTRSDDFSNARGVIAGLVVVPSEGTKYKGSFWVLETPNPITVDSTSLTFTRSVSKDNTSIANLTDQQTGLLARTEYGDIQTRSVTSTHSFITITNPKGIAGDIQLGIGTLPVSKGGTGRTNILGYMKGVGAAITSLAAIPYTDVSGLGTIVTQDADNVTITGGSIVVPTADISNLVGNTITTGDLVVTNNITADNITSNIQLTSQDLYVSGNVALPNLKGDAIELGTNNTGALSGNAANLTTSTSVTDSIAILNSVLSKLIPPPPPLFPDGQTLEIIGTENYRIADFVQSDFTTTQDQNRSGGEVVSVLRTPAFTTTTIANVWPGDYGTITAYRDNTLVGNVTLTDADDSGTYGELVISNDRDYHELVPSVAPGFWDIFDANMEGNVGAETGWHDLRISHTADGSAERTYWYADLTDPGSPGIDNKSMTPTTEIVTYSSTIPHYTNQTTFTISFDASKLSGDTFPLNNQFITSIAGGAFDAPGNVSYSDVGITTPLPQNLYVSSGSVNINFVTNVKSGFGVATTSYGPTISVDNSYHVTDEMFTPSNTVLYKTGNSNSVDEGNIFVGTVGIGSANGARIENPGTGNNPVITGFESLFNSETSTLQNYDATVVGSVLKHDNTNYSTGYLPQGPNLSGRAAEQYFTFRFSRIAVSKFDIKFSGTLAGAWVALPGSAIDTTASSTNGWLPLTEAYIGAGIPGLDGNGYNGCTVGGTIPVNSLQTNSTTTVTFGTETSSNATNNNVYIRIKLTAGQEITALSIEEATN